MFPKAVIPNDLIVPILVIPVSGVLFISTLAPIALINIPFFS